MIEWEEFRSTLGRIRSKDRKSNAGRKPFDVVLMFKALVLQHLYNLSDDEVEYLIRDRYSFCRFLGMTQEDKSPERFDDNPNVKRQKNTDARWTKKNGQAYYGYKNHVSIDKQHKLIRGYEVTTAEVHVSQIFYELLRDNTAKDIWTDNAYSSEVFQPSHLVRLQATILPLSVKVGRLADASFAADLRDRRAFFALLQDERLLRLRELRCFQAFPLLSQPGKLS